MSMRQDARERPLEDVLGDRQGRFFGDGYTTVDRTWAGGDDGKGGLRGTGRAVYPEGWSVDPGAGSRRPHLSSIDAVAFPIMALQTAFDDPRRMWIDTIILRAGSRPWHFLEEIPITIRPERSSPQNHPRSLSYAAMTGNIRLDLGLRIVDDDAAFKPSLTNSRSRGDGSVYGDLFKGQNPRTRLALDGMGQPLLRARHEFEFPERTDSARTASGIESAYWPAVTIVDHIVGFGQLVQVLALERLGLAREHGELWMKTVTIKRASPPRAVPTELTSQTRIVSARTVDRRERKLHRLSIEATSSDDVAVTAALAFVEHR